MYAPTFLTRLRPWLWYTLLLVLASITVFGSVAADPGGQVVANNDDSSLFIWWLGHTAEVVARTFGFGSGFGSGLFGGAGPWPADGLLHTEAMNALGGGVNGAWNTSLVAPGLVLAPLTWIAGPIVSYNVLVLSIPVLNSLAAALLFTRFLPRTSAFIAAGGVGFSSYVIAQLSGHPNLAFAVTAPITACAILSLLGIGSRASARTGVAAPADAGTPASAGIPASAGTAPSTTPERRARRFWAVSIGLGLMLGVQFYFSTEVLAGTFLAALCFLVSLAVFARRVLSRRAWADLAGGGVLASVLALVLALPLLLRMRGPMAPDGPIRPHGVWNTDLLDPIIPAVPTWLGAGESPIPRIMDIDGAELGAYVGAPALVAALLIVVGLIRRRRYSLPLRVASATGLLVFALALGSPVLLGGKVLLSSGPFALIEALPVLENILPMRLVLYSTIALFAILGIGLDWSLARIRTPRGKGLLGLLVLAGVCVLPGVQSSRTVYVPDFYDGTLAEVVPEGSVVKTFPRPLAWAEPHADEAMVWQAVSGFRYRETGGYFIGSSPDSPVTYAAPEDALDRVLHDSGFSGGPLPDPSSREVTAALDELRRTGVDAIVLAPEAPLLPGGDEEYAQFLDTAIGQPEYDDEGVRVYSLND